MKILTLSIYFILINYSLQFNNIVQIKNLKKCQKKIFLGYKYFNLKVVPKIKENTKTQINEFDKLKNKKDFIESSIDASSVDVVDELSSLLALITDTNKEFLFVFQRIISQYIKYNLLDNFNKKYELGFETIDIIRIIIKNVIIPTIIHDSFQTFIHLFNSKTN